MGSGKTYWGRIWAQKSGFTFIDLDEVIENAEGKTVTAIFEMNGEDQFREIEAATLRSFGAMENTIIACGGGTPCFHKNMQWMNEHGTTVYLAATATEIIERLIKEQEKRPLIKKLNTQELLLFIEQKLKERAPFYHSAKVILSSSELSKSSFGDLVARS